MSNAEIKITIADEKTMLALGQQLANTCENGCVVFLSGPLGAGKTTFVRGFLRGLGYSGHVKSPTYTLVEPYEIHERAVYHFDFYRVRNPHELEFMGIQDYFSPTAICLIEWPEYGGELLPKADLLYDIQQIAGGRMVTLTAQTTLGNKILQRILYDE